jgi:hypothetical protein
VFGLPDLGALPPLRDLGDNAELILEADLVVAPEGVAPTPVQEEAIPPAIEAEPEPPGDEA